ncbi:MAG: L-threonylcarbamoyladenylate synthase [Candidatus Nanopelagicales bacterium]|nr:L-threonylcarbamoyladenylate synthase [Candidatus Nanopelagicales bacterium]
MAVREDRGGHPSSRLLNAETAGSALRLNPQQAASALVAGHLAILPTETVYGLAADARQPATVARVFQVKGRPTDHPVIVHVGSAAAIADWSANTPDVAWKLAETFWPGPLTIVVPAAASVSRVLTGGQDTIALRCPAQQQFLEVLDHMSRRQGLASAVAAPSANRFGQVSPTTAADALRGLRSRLSADDVVLDGGACQIGVESTVVDCTARPIRILRPGRIGRRQLAEVLGWDAVAAVGTGTSTTAADESEEQVRVPGTLPSHYAPITPVSVVDAATLSAYGRHPNTTDRVIGLIAPASVATPVGLHRIGSPANSRDYAHGLYSWFRRADDLGCSELLVALPLDPVDDPLADAVADRVRRATHPPTT